MPQLTFKMSDDQKFNYLWQLLNPNYSDDNEWIVENIVCDVYDDYAIVYNCAEDIYERVYYTKDDANDSITIDRKERCYILDVTESEKKALDAVRSLNDNTYDLVDEKFAEIPVLN
jgi:hypothetical protein